MVKIQIREEMLSEIKSISWFQIWNEALYLSAMLTLLLASIVSVLILIIIVVYCNILYFTKLLNCNFFKNKLVSIFGLTITNVVLNILNAINKFCVKNKNILDFVWSYWETFLSKLTKIKKTAYWYIIDINNHVDFAITLFLGFLKGIVPAVVSLLVIFLGLKFVLIYLIFYKFPRWIFIIFYTFFSKCIGKEKKELLKKKVKNFYILVTGVFINFYWSIFNKIIIFLYKSFLYIVMLILQYLPKFLTFVLVGDFNNSYIESQFMKINNYSILIWTLIKGYLLRCYYFYLKINSILMVIYFFFVDLIRLFTLFFAKHIHAFIKFWLLSWIYINTLYAVVMHICTPDWIIYFKLHICVVLVFY